MMIPIDKNIIESEISALKINSLSKASIRECVRLASNLEKKTGVKFIRMEMGIPGLPPDPNGVEAQINALKQNVAAIYPSIEGITELKEEIAKFAKLFMDINVKPQHCFPTTGSMQGSFAAFMITGATKKNSKTLFIDPGFSVQKQQLRILGLPYDSFDIYNHRGAKLEKQLESLMTANNYSSIIYSSPNNPSWIIFTEKELEIIGRLCEKFDVIAIEDLAYFAMDFRKDYSVPGKPPFQPTIAKFTDNYIILISSSKLFSYAGERIAAMLVSDKLANRNYPELTAKFATENFAHALVYGALYCLSSGTSHSAQYAFVAMLKAANSGKPFLEPVKEYAKRSMEIKKIFLKHGFNIVYSMDDTEQIADGFYFTLAYKNMETDTLIFELLRYGISAISLEITGSSLHGIRACVSQTDAKSIEILKERIELFGKNH